MKVLLLPLLLLLIIKRTNQLIVRTNQYHRRCCRHPLQKTTTTNNKVAKYISLKSKAATLERQNKSIRNANMSANDNKDTTGDNDNNNNDVSSDLPSDASDAACSSNFITTDKIWERTFQPGSTRINNELIVCAVFKTILQSAEKIHIYPIVGENAIDRMDRYLYCICTDLKDKIAGENEAKSEKFRGNAICNIREKFTEDDQEILKTYMLSVTRGKFAKLTEVVSKLLRCHFQQYINLVSIIESKHVVERPVKNAFKGGCEKCDIDNIDDSFIDQPLKQFARHLWKIHGAN